jgi:hypothetical protein
MCRIFRVKERMAGCERNSQFVAPELHYAIHHMKSGQHVAACSRPEIFAARNAADVARASDFPIIAEIFQLHTAAIPPRTSDFWPSTLPIHI